MDKANQFSNSRESLKIDDSRVSNISEISDDDNDYIITSKNYDLSKFSENNNETENDNILKKKLYFTPSIPTKVNSANNLQNNQKTFLVRNQYETSKKLVDIKLRIEELVKKYSNDIQKEINELNKNYQDNFEDITEKQKDFYEKDIKLYIKKDIDDLWNYISLREKINEDLINKFEESSNNTLQEMLDEIKTLLENYVNKNPFQPLHFLIEESFKANKTVVTTKENIILICKNFLLNNANIFKEFHISRKYFENDWAKERIPYLINEFSNTINENPQFFNFEFEEIQEKIYFYYSKQIDQVNALNELNYENMNDDYLNEWKKTTDDINVKLEKTINDLVDQYSKFDELKIKFINDTKNNTKKKLLECDNDLDADYMIDSKLLEIFNNFKEEDFPLVFNKIRSCLKKNKEIIRILGDILLVLISVKAQQTDHINGIEHTVEDKIYKDYEESKSNLIKIKEQLLKEIDNLRKTEFEPNITNKYKEIKEILKKYEDDYHKVIETMENNLKLYNFELNTCFDKYKSTIYNILSLTDSQQKAKLDNSTTSNHDGKKKNINHDSKRKTNYDGSSVNIESKIHGHNNYNHNNYNNDNSNNNNSNNNNANNTSNNDANEEIIPFNFSLDDNIDVDAIKLNVIPHDIISKFRIYIATLLIKKINKWKEEAGKLLYKNLNVKLKKLKNKFNQEFYHNNEEDTVYERKLAEINEQKSQAVIEAEILMYNIEEMKNNYKNTIIELEDKANKLVEEMNNYLNIPTDKVNSDIHYKFEKKTKNKIDQLKLLVDKATEEYNNKRIMIRESRTKNPYAWEMIPNGEKLYEDIKPYYNSFNQKIIQIEENLEKNLLDINSKIRMHLCENQFYETIRKNIKSFDMKILATIFKIKNYNKEINEGRNMINILYKELEKKGNISIIPKILSYVYSTKKLFNSLGIYLLGFNDDMDKESYVEMMQSIKFINFDEWLKRDNNENKKKMLKKKKNKSGEILNGDKNKDKNNKRIDINNLEEVLESNFEELVINMKVNCYNSVISIGESFFKDPTNYSERFQDIAKFKEYINEEFSKMIESILNKKEKFIDDYEKTMDEIFYNISTVISKKIFKSIYLNVQKSQNIQWLEKMNHFDKQIQSILQRNDVDILLIKPYCNKHELEIYKENAISEKENKLLDVDNLYNDIYNICVKNIQKFSNYNLYVTEVLYNIMASPSYRKKIIGN
ncbi:hypothetical protein PIROE2DRAFT_5518 [Piromyces sp. E2]|nr:hypothetical protein PIROE2DRAFT_5518 [Piromyces sp. E2]|eukprot:OUM67136.1 hypothetical protein PIROE2DRAFT_5518 [Piromyces sp. E2]